MGGMGIPGDLSSQSRFVKVAFTKLNSCLLMDGGIKLCNFQKFHIFPITFKKFSMVCYNGK